MAEELINPLAEFGVLAEVLDGRVILTCGKHFYSYSAHRQPTPGCKGCHFVQHLGLLVSVPAERRDEILEDLEYSIHHLCEAEMNGTLDLENLERVGQRVKIESPDGKVKEF